MITAKEAQKRMNDTRKRWESKHEALLKRIEAIIIERVDEGYDYALFCSDNVNKNKLCDVLTAYGFDVSGMSSGDVIKISWE